MLDYITHLIGLLFPHRPPKCTPTPPFDGCIPSGVLGL